MTAPSTTQIETLLNFLEEHRDLARGTLRNVEGRLQAQRLWRDVCDTLNAMGGCTKTVQQWQRVWTDKKYWAKKNVAAARRSATTTGGGPPSAPPLSRWDTKVLNIMGDGFGEPQTTAAVPAFVVSESMPSPLGSQPAIASPPRTQELIEIHTGWYLFYTYFV
ncbi:uncharacterized protein LOC121736226 [Aricia agestis]|uniref:uncharacterized protein LOC121736226 n=1 Tax=Aricia agestis TaxID=91739 RepID=UPI001C203ACA|nr:uncharacterized protein LOC121736226 [Aricia agestis]